MKRDLNLIRSIMLAVEDSECGVITEDFFADELSCHFVNCQFNLIADAGFAIVEKIGNSEYVFDRRHVHRLTDRGHNILNQIRDDNKWASIQQYLDICSFEMILEILSNREIKSHDNIFDSLTWKEDPNNEYRYKSTTTIPESILLKVSREILEFENRDNDSLSAKEFSLDEIDPVYKSIALKILQLVHYPKANK